MHKEILVRVHFRVAARVYRTMLAFMVNLSVTSALGHLFYSTSISYCFLFQINELTIQADD